ncbi:MAG TPA: bifunctional phosphoribosyl-AMP cyclohydrolase/phosphoribosyl-ATP diphosphatase HisIE [Acidimicrobiia bacterium]|nr:bifunctional phosphoribosyl-AMP cyclohydrolase/phosphoribosyl-ATP diphosphatase HisIE [Acidimicrobiia bacterium]
MIPWPAEVELVPAVVQDEDSERVLMLAWMNAEAYQRTLDRGFVTFWSRSREELWEKGETSGNRLELASLVWDCDADSILVTARPTGPTCHTGTVTCFDDRPLDPGFARLDRLWGVIADRARLLPSGSYTTALLESGPEATGRKVTEEAVEVLLAVKDHAHGRADDRRVAEEVADLFFHALVVLAERDIDPGLVLDVLDERRR